MTGNLRQNGFDVASAGSLAAARRALQQDAFDAMALDLMLPDGDGLDHDGGRAGAVHARLGLAAAAAPGRSARAGRGRRA